MTWELDPVHISGIQGLTVEEIFLRSQCYLNVSQFTKENFVLFKLWKLPTISFWPYKFSWKMLEECVVMQILNNLLLIYFKNFQGIKPILFQCKYHLFLISQWQFFSKRHQTMFAPWMFMKHFHSFNWIPPFTRKIFNQSGTLSAQKLWPGKWADAADTAPVCNTAILGHRILTHGRTKFSFLLNAYWLCNYYIHNYKFLFP